MTIVFITCIDLINIPETTYYMQVTRNTFILHVAAKLHLVCI